ncbi:cyclic beta 1-2 glucan synthetase [Clostridium senegalense]|uniref:GH36-type glycosyl hydrolase domain-containing protein n=1 Tax=Clostridium senegalense TaxID=1465809 RepID=UPI001C0F7398|nr:glucoamylase family protein [Clostridium senegalense]MBU5226242.1 cyclic beta 1-2 glucan synthetase [Clostridium senegalense]
MIYIFFSLLVVLTFIILYFNNKLVYKYKFLKYCIKINKSSKSSTIIAQEIALETSAVDYSLNSKIKTVTVDRNYKNIKKVYEKIKNNPRASVVSGSQWIIDNIYIIHKEYKNLKQSLRRKNLKKLPRIKDGIFSGFPRVYVLALNFINDRLAYIDENTITEFIEEYEKENKLTMGEIWYFPIMIKVVIIQYIDKLSEEIYCQINSLEKALDIYSKSLEKKNINPLIKDKDVDKETILKLLTILKDTGKDDEKITLELKELVKSIEVNSVLNEINIYKKENLRNMLLSNSVNSLIEISKINYRYIFERVSIVEKILSKDYFYNQMDFQSKDQYRRVISEISLKNDIRESYIAEKAMKCKEVSEGEEFKNHIGYYLIDEGRDKLNNILKIKYSGFEKIKRMIKGKAVISYLLLIFIFTAINIITFLYAIPGKNEYNYKIILAVIFLIIPMSDVAIRGLNFTIMRINKPYTLPKLNLENIPYEYSTSVIIPTIINNKKRAKELLENIEQYYLGNKDENIFFVLLGDLKDSKKLNLEDDDDIINFTLEEVKKLNLKYCKNKKEQFFFLCRHRVFNEGENLYIGYERKRGKIVEFNQLLMGNEETTFRIISGDLKNLSKVKYVITLDSDTKLPMNGAKKLIGTLAHPLNKGYIGSNGKVIRGYGLLQPRISISLASSNKTIFSKLFSGECGIDIYTTAVSDVYQDLFKEGIFTGKGIYDLDIFCKTLDNKIPENTVLSHDLLEGSYLRCGLVSDIELIDDYPSFYNANSKRKHRWVRGDWQLTPWLYSDDINLLSKWKILDNLRRSLVSIFLILSLILITFKILPGNVGYWIMLIILWSFTSFPSNLFNFVKNISKGFILKEEFILVRESFFRSLLILIFLPYEAYLNLDAIIRTIYRKNFSHKNLLQWQTSDYVERTSKRNFTTYLNTMFQSILIGIGILLINVLLNQSNILLILVTALWIMAPLIAYLISIPKKTKKYILNNEDEILIRTISRRTWAYFEDFIDERCNYIGVDNYQEDPGKKLAYRTSPTNIGMCIISNIVALDLGYINIIQATERIEKTIENINTLEKYKGHLFNWYDSSNKKALNPKYVSTVDSGNLITYLYTTYEGLNENLNTPIMEKIILGLKDILNLTIEEIKDIECNHYFYFMVKDNLNNRCKDLLTFKTMISNIICNTEELLSEHEGSNEEGKFYWCNKLINHCKMQLKYINEVFPFIKELELYDNMTIANLTTRFVNSPITAYKDIVGEALKEVSSKEGIDILLKTNFSVDKIISRINCLNEKIITMCEDMDFSFLYDSKRGLLSIGFDLEKESLTNNYYDLLASEARSAYFIAICKRDIPVESWFSLGRLLGGKSNNKGLMSWSGTMFEYFMPRLIMKNYENTLIDESYKYALKNQIDYGKKLRLPFGISESAYYEFDKDLNYQYKAFGVPKIALKNYNDKEIVIAPYATILSLMENKKCAIENLNILIENDVYGKYGLYEAVDYTKNRAETENGNGKIVKSYMIHHLGMSIMAIDNVLNENILQKYFHENPIIKANELLLQEKRSKKIIYDNKYNVGNIDILNSSSHIEKIPPRTVKNILEDPIKFSIMSNKNYSLVMSNTGFGYSKFDEILVNRYRNTMPENSSGVFFYLKEIKRDRYVSTTYEPVREDYERYSACFYLDRAEFFRNDEDKLVKTTVFIHKDENMEVRAVKIYNKGNEKKVLELTSYCEIVLQSYEGDLSHPAFGNLFIKTNYYEDDEIVVANRRVRNKKEKSPYVAQCLIGDSENIGALEFETSREKFIGRCRNKKEPIALIDNEKLSSSVGAVLDPIISLRRRFEISSKETIEFYFISAVSFDKTKCVDLIKKYKDINKIKSLPILCKEHIQQQLLNLNITTLQANLYQDFLTDILLPQEDNKDKFQNIVKPQGKKADLWKYGISGDIPIIVVEIYKESHLYLLRQIIDCHKYLTTNKLKIDLVIINRECSSYEMPIMETINNIIVKNEIEYLKDKDGGIHIISNISDEDFNVIKFISALHFDGSNGDVFEQIKHNKFKKDLKPQVLLKIISEKKYEKSKRFNLVRNKVVKDLEFFNGYGGFSDNGKSYTIVIKNSNPTPMPWINVIANKDFGFIISEVGSSYTWYKNSRENKLTSWNNDSVIDQSAENIYLCDNDEIWNITRPTYEDKDDEVIVKHGMGFSKFVKENRGIYTESTFFVPQDKNIKIIKIKLCNTTNKKRNFKLGYYGELVLGDVRDKTYRTIVTNINNIDGYITADNFYNENFKETKCYLAFSEKNTILTGHRDNFLGYNGDIKEPDGLRNITLESSCGKGLNPCLAGVTSIELNEFEEKFITIILGAEENILDIEKQIKYFRKLENVDIELEKSQKYWSDKLELIQVKTEDRSLDIMVNGWLLYQSLSCRIWARTAFYQCGGAFGFRDQLQDVMSIIYFDKSITKNQILYSASYQFEEGDVMHWWHPYSECGIRTKFSDDLLWLPYVVCDYIERTGDISILDDEVRYIKGEPLKDDIDEFYGKVKKSHRKETIYEHCIKAIEKSLKFGIHDLPLIGSGDWNDGMSTIGNKGKGESVWLAWFIYSVLDNFKYLCKEKGDLNLYEKYTGAMEKLKVAVEKNGWDGNWYKRAYFDDGTPLGSSENDECRIDSISQSWSVISKCADISRAKKAMSNLYRYLINKQEGIIMLLTPSFDKSNLEPGYIKGYIPGVRENGGQYTHGAIWTILAYAILNEGEKAVELFNMINPINHSKDFSTANKYKVEPYVMCADVYSSFPHNGRGGWSYYTGSASWMYKVAIEAILGFKLKDGKGFTIEPLKNIPFKKYTITHKTDKSTYIINVEYGKENEIYLDGNLIKSNFIKYENGEHSLIYRIKNQ